MRSKSCRVRALPFVAILLERGRERREDDDGADDDTNIVDGFDEINL